MLRANTLIVDDDKLWQKSISKLVLMSPNLNLIGTCSSAMEAYAKIVENDIDLIICDIEMPEMSGLDFIRSIKNPPLVIFITSHRDYALDCYEVSPVDFLLKPLEVPRFLASIEKHDFDLLTHQIFLLYSLTFSFGKIIVTFKLPTKRFCIWSQKIIF